MAEAFLTTAAMEVPQQGDAFEDSAPTIGLLIETTPGQGAFLPAVFSGKELKAIGQPIIAGSLAPGGDMWKGLQAQGWKWSQEGSFAPKYWRRSGPGDSATPARRGKRKS